MRQRKSSSCIACRGNRVLRVIQQRRQPDRLSAFRRFGRGTLLFKNPNDFLDWRYAGDRFLGKGRRVGYRPGKLSIDVNGAAAHSLKNTRRSNWTAGKSRQNLVLIRAYVV